MPLIPSGRKRQIASPAASAASTAAKQAATFRDAIHAGVAIDDAGADRPDPRLGIGAGAAPARQLKRMPGSAGERGRARAPSRPRTARPPQADAPVDVAARRPNRARLGRIADAAGCRPASFAELAMRSDQARTRSRGSRETPRAPTAVDAHDEGRGGAPPRSPPQPPLDPVGQPADCDLLVSGIRRGEIIRVERPAEDNRHPRPKAGDVLEVEADRHDGHRVAGDGARSPSAPLPSAAAPAGPLNG